jgi:hypothetical protein
MNESYVKEKLTATLNQLISQKKLTSVILKENLTVEEIFELEKLKLA